MFEGKIGQQAAEKAKKIEVFKRFSATKTYTFCQ